MTTKLDALKSIREQLKLATGPSERLAAEILQIIVAPDGYVEQSKINGNWCIYEPTKRLWERRGDWWRRDGWPLTSSLDAAIAFVERVLPAANCHGYDKSPSGVTAYVSRNYVAEGHWMVAADHKTLALALLLAAFNALISIEEGKAK